MPLLQIYLRENAVKSKEQKAEMIKRCSDVVAEVIGNGNEKKVEQFRQRVTVNIIELPNENWGLKGEQYEPGKQFDDLNFS